MHTKCLGVAYKRLCITRGGAGGLLLFRAMGIEHSLKGKVKQNAVIQTIAMPGYIMAVIFINKVRTVL
jgi:hypothetical protein